LNLQAICHIPKSNYAYAYNEKELHIRIRTAKNDCDSVTLVIAKKHAWQDKQPFSMDKVASDRLFDYYHYNYHTEDSRLGYYFEISANGQTLIYSESGLTKTFDDDNSYFHYFQYPYICSADVHRVPSWVNETVFYEIFVDRFNNGDHQNDPENLTPWGQAPSPKSLYGGDLQGILDKLDYLQNLGVNGLYLTPIFQSPTNHKYDTEDYHQVDKAFGDKVLLVSLVKAAHEKGIRIILDGVFNHSSIFFAPFQDVMKKGELSQYKDWYFIERYPVIPALGNYRVFGTSSGMPKLNTANPEVQKYILDTVVYWMKETNIDGWRLDVSDEVDHDFWRKFRKTVKEINPEAAIIGENWHNAYPWLMGDQFDSVMNYPVTKSCIQFFAKQEIRAQQFSEDLSSSLMWNFEQVNFAMMNLLDSHDTMRFLTWCGGNIDKFKLAVLFLFSYIGMPCVYYGSEIGMEGKGDPDCRRTFDWDEQHWCQDLWLFYQKIIALRRQWKPLQYGEVRLNAENDVLLLQRSFQGETLLTMINNTDESKRLQLPWKSVHNLFTGKAEPSEIVLPTYGGGIYLVKA